MASIDREERRRSMRGRAGREAGRSAGIAGPSDDRVCCPDQSSRFGRPSRPYRPGRRPLGQFTAETSMFPGVPQGLNSSAPRALNRDRKSLARACSLSNPVWCKAAYIPSSCSTGSRSSLSSSPRRTKPLERVSRFTPPGEDCAFVTRRWLWVAGQKTLQHAFAPGKCDVLIPRIDVAEARHGENPACSLA